MGRTTEGTGALSEQAARWKGKLARLWAFACWTAWSGLSGVGLATCLGITWHNDAFLMAGLAAMTGLLAGFASLLRDAMPAGAGRLGSPAASR
jgi:hypothetical protein